VYSGGGEIVENVAPNKSTYWANCIATENSIIMFYSTEMNSQVWEYKRGVGRPIWKLPYGYTIKDMTYNNGVVYVTGHWDAADGTVGYGELKALVLESYRPLSLKTVRKSDGQGTAMALGAASTSYAAQIMLCATHTGKIWVYDAETDGLTMLDDLNKDTSADPDGMSYPSGSRIGATCTYGSKRLVAVYGPGLGASDAEYQIVNYDDDEVNQIEKDLNTTDWTGYLGYFESSSWDYNYPMERKSLIGFHLTFKPLVAGQTLDVSYALDSDSFTSLTQVTSSTGGADVGRVFIPVATVSDAKRFFNLKFRVKLASQGDTITVPILYAVTAEAKLVRKREEWILALRLKDETQRTRMSDRLNRGSTIRDRILTLVANGAPVTFLDGFRYRGRVPDQYSTHTVVIKEAEDIIEQPGEGTCIVRLVATTGAT
jgi:hypothetical protein